MTTPTDIGEIALIFFSIRDQLKIYHFQTLSYARHKSSDGLVDKLTDKLDTFLESMQGARNIRLKLPSDNVINLEDQTDNSILEILQKFKTWLTHSNGLPKYLNPQDTDLFNMRDDILGHVNQTLYLFTFQ